MKTKNEKNYVGKVVYNLTILSLTDRENKYSKVWECRFSCGEIIQENCTPCCKDCNFAKGTMSEDEYIELIKKSYFKLFNRNNIDNLIIGISGASRVGKDTYANNILKFCNSNNINAKIYSFAYALKKDLKELIFDKFKIDVFTDNTEEKSLIRPIFVSYGEMAREISKGDFWWRKVKQDIDEGFKNGNRVAIISDFRFADPRFKNNDEIDFIKSYPNNLTSFIEQDKINPVFSEIENLPIIKEQSDIKISWPHFGVENIHESEKYMGETYNKILEKLK